MPAADLILAWFDRQRLWLLGFAGLLIVGAYSTSWRVTPDSALFLGLGRNLAAGRGFTFNEQVITTVNPGFPRVLSLIFRAGGEPIALANALILVISIASLALVFALFHRHAGRPLAVLVTFLTAINSTFHRHTGEILADMPFFFCCTLALLGYEMTFTRTAAADKARPVAGGVLVMLGLAGMAWLRLVVIGPLIAIVIDLGWRLRRSRFKWALLAAAGAILLAALAVRLADPRMAGGFMLLSKEREIVESVRNLPTTLERIRDFTGPRLLTDVTPRAILGNKAGLWPVDAVISLLVLASGFMLLRRRVAWAVLIGIYFAQWLMFFPDSRYFLPVIPLLMLGWWDLATWFASRTPGSWQKAVFACLFALLVIPNLARAVGFVIDQHRAPYLEHYMRGRFRDLPAIAARAGTNLPANSVIIAGEQFALPLHYLSGQRTISTSGPLLLGEIPPGRPLFALLPADPGFDQVLQSAGLRLGATVIGDPADKNTLSIVTLIPAAPSLSH